MLKLAIAFGCAALVALGYFLYDAQRAPQPSDQTGETSTETPEKRKPAPPKVDLGVPATNNEPESTPSVVDEPEVQPEPIRLPALTYDRETAHSLGLLSYDDLTDEERALIEDLPDSFYVRAEHMPIMRLYFEDPSDVELTPRLRRWLLEYRDLSVALLSAKPRHRAECLANGDYQIFDNSKEAHEAKSEGPDRSWGKSADGRWYVVDHSKITDDIRQIVIEKQRLGNEMYAANAPTIQLGVPPHPPFLPELPGT